MIGQILQPQRGAGGGGDAGAQQALRHTGSGAAGVAGYDEAAYAAAESAAPHVGDSATSVGALPKPEFEERQLLSSRSRGPGSGGLLIGQSLAGVRGLPGQASPFEMGRMSQGALDRVNQVRPAACAPGKARLGRACLLRAQTRPAGLNCAATAWLSLSPPPPCSAPCSVSDRPACLGCERASVPAHAERGGARAQAFNSSFFQPGAAGAPGHGVMGARPSVTASSEAGSDAALLENGCTPGSLESVSSAGGGGGGGGSVVGGTPPLALPQPGAPVGMAGALPGQRSQDLSLGMYYQPAALGLSYLGLGPGLGQGLVPGLGQGIGQVPAQGLGPGMGQGLGQGLGMGQYGSLPLAGAPIGAGGPPFGGGGGGGPRGGYLPFAGVAGGSGAAPIGRASVDWFAGGAGPPAAPPMGGARIGRSSFDGSGYRSAGAAAPMGVGGSGAPIGGGLMAPLIGGGAGPLIGGMPVPLAGAPHGHGGLGAPGRPLPLVAGALPAAGMASSALAYGVGQVPGLDAAKASLPFPPAPVSVGEAAAVDFGSSLYNQPGAGGAAAADLSVARRTSSLESLGAPDGSVLGLGFGRAGAAAGVPPSVFSASSDSEAGPAPPGEAGRGAGAYASGGGGRGDAGPALAPMGSVAEDAVFHSGGDPPRAIKARAPAAPPPAHPRPLLRGSMRGGGHAPGQSVHTWLQAHGSAQARRRRCAGA